MMHSIMQRWAAEIWTLGIFLGFNALASRFNGRPFWQNCLNSLLVLLVVGCLVYLIEALPEWRAGGND